MAVMEWWTRARDQADYAREIGSVQGCPAAG